MQPNLSASGFERWLSLLENGRGEPAGYGALIVKAVPASQLAAFQEARNADPAFRALVGGQLESVAGERTRPLLPARRRAAPTSSTARKSPDCCRATGVIQRR